MKRLYAFLLMISLGLFLSAIEMGDDSDFFKIMPVYFAADTTAYIGFSTAEVDSISKPSSDTDSFEFKFNEVSGNYETPDIYYYLQAFQTGLYKCEVTLSGELKPESSEGSVSSLEYNILAESSFVPATWSDTDTKISGELEILENKPDVVCGSFVLSIPGDTAFDKSIRYADTITITCTYS